MQTLDRTMKSGRTGKANLDAVNIMVADPEVMSRNVTCDILFEMGFREVHRGSGIEDVEKVMAAEVPLDILICSSALKDDPVSRLVHGIRHRNIGKNPFLSVMVMADEPTPDSVKKLMGTGADIMLRKPVSAGDVGDGIKHLVASRKPFVVTSDYIGPTRRNESRIKSDIPLFTVPNTARVKMLGGSEQYLLEQAINETIVEMNLQKIHCHAGRIKSIADSVITAYRGKGEKSAPGDVAADLDRLLKIAKDACHRMRRTRYAPLSELCQLLIEITNEVRRNLNKPATTNLKILREISVALEAALMGGVGAEAAVREIVGLVDRRGEHSAMVH